MWIISLAVGIVLDWTSDPTLFVFFCCALILFVFYSSCLIGIQFLLDVMFLAPTVCVWVRELSLLCGRNLSKIWYLYAQPILVISAQIIEG